MNSFIVIEDLVQKSTSMHKYVSELQFNFVQLTSGSGDLAQ